MHIAMDIRLYVRIYQCSTLATTMYLYVSMYVSMYAKPLDMLRVKDNAKIAVAGRCDKQEN